jgi:hypothetical protein
MKILNPTGNPDCGHDQYDVVFEQRNIEDLCDSSSQEPFDKVRRQSEAFDKIYRMVAQPWVQLAVKATNPSITRAFHPMRLRKTLFSERYNPSLIGLAWLAKWVRESRIEQRDTEFHRIERQIAGKVRDTIAQRTRARDASAKKLFDFLYGARATSK